jgi:2-polyprenyl-3-methyl-5-hydroxy-6-metoxy-1,4-benzoquinol methylase
VPLARQLIAAGILEPADGRSYQSDRRNLSAKNAFAEHAAAWISSTYEATDSDSFAHTRAALSKAWIERLAGDRSCRVVDLGCGDGRLLVDLARIGHRVHGVDSSGAMINMCRQRIANEPRDVQQRITIECGDATQWGARDVQFVTALGLMAWFDQPDRLVAAARARLMDGGYFIAGFPNALVTPDGPAWYFRPRSHHDVISSVISLTRDLLAANATPWLECYRRACRDADAGLRELISPTLSAVTRRRDHERTNMPPRERRYSPDEVRRLAKSGGFAVITMAGIGETRSVFDYLFAKPIATLMNMPLASMRALPCGLLWSTGFLAMLAVREKGAG